MYGCMYVCMYRDSDGDRGTLTTTTLIKKESNQEKREKKIVVDYITNREVSTPRWAKELAHSISEEIITNLHCINLGNLK